MLQWYNLYVKILKDEGYLLNDYAKCVGNKVINSKQCTIAWYLDKNEASHVDPKVIDVFLEVI